jgi:hypothetical protein
MLCQAGADPRFLMGQLDHTSAALSLQVYAQVLQSGNRDVADRMDGLLRSEWARS